MNIDENTKIIGRFHSKVSPRGLNIYNPTFQELGINALYLLFYDPSPEKLFEGMSDLNLSGAVTVGFETDPRLAKLVDEFDDMAKYLGRVGFVKNVNGKIVASVQSGEAMFRTISQTENMLGKNIVIVGSGQVCKSLLYFISKQKDLPNSVEIFNRTVEKAENLAKEYSFVKSVGPLASLKDKKGDILVNLSHLGGSEEDDLFTEKIINNFEAVTDVTFEKENTNLISLARKLNKKYSTGWDMFTYQGQIVLESILDQKIPTDVLKKHVIKGLSQTVT